MSKSHFCLYFIKWFTVSSQLSNITEYLLCFRHFRGDNNKQDMFLAFKEHNQLHNFILLDKNPKNPSFDFIKSGEFPAKEKLRILPLLLPSGVYQKTLKYSLTCIIKRKTTSNKPTGTNRRILPSRPQGCLKGYIDR